MSVINSILVGRFLARVGVSWKNDNPGSAAFLAKFESKLKTLSWFI